MTSISWDRHTAYWKISFFLTQLNLAGSLLAALEVITHYGWVNSRQGTDTMLHSCAFWSREINEVKKCKALLRWLCREQTSQCAAEEHQWSIGRSVGLAERMIERDCETSWTHQILPRDPDVQWYATAQWHICDSKKSKRVVAVSVI